MVLHVINFPFNILREIFWWFVENHSTSSDNIFSEGTSIYSATIQMKGSGIVWWSTSIIPIPPASISIRTSIRNVVWDATECQDLIKVFDSVLLSQGSHLETHFLFVFIIMVFLLWNKNYLNPFLNLSLKLQNRPN